MKREDIIIGNIVIASYMGWKLDDSFPDKGRVYRLGNSIELDSTLKYDSSLELLFEVIEKMSLKGDMHRVWFNENGSLKEVANGSRDEDKLKAIYKAVIDFIRWYNEKGD
jgi:hypothetical protein